MTATIELNSARRKLQSALANEGDQKAYFAHLRNWFRKRCSKADFDAEARRLLPADHAHLHNEFLLAILNKCQTLASFALTSPPLASNSAPSLIKPSVAAPSPANPARDIDGRLKVGSVKRVNKAASASKFDQRFQPATGDDNLPDVDDHELFDPVEKNLAYAFREPLLPDARLVAGRLLVAAWEEGLDGDASGPEVTKLVVVAVHQLLKRIVSSILMDRSGYRVYGRKMVHSIGASGAVNPYLNNAQKVATTSTNPEIVESLVFSNMTANMDPIFPATRPHERDAEHEAMWELACAEKSEYKERLPVNLYDLMDTLSKHKKTLIPSHSVYSVNMERLVCRLHHKGRDD